MVCSRSARVRPSRRGRRRLFLAPLDVSSFLDWEDGTYLKRPLCTCGDLGNDIPSLRFYRGIRH